MQERYCLQMVACNGGCGSHNSGDGAPVGTVISYMGNKAPHHYLVCDGAVLNISDYPELSRQIHDEFGAIDYFGGDGTATFAVPDLRGEFLRGTGTNGSTALAGGEVGKNQKPTMIAYTRAHCDASESFYWIGGYCEGENKNVEGELKDSKGFVYSKGTLGTEPAYLNQTSSFASRPTNMAVLYCIKYELD